MSLFKREPDIDYTLLQKKGIIKKSNVEKGNVKFSKDGLVDLTGSNPISDVQNSSVQQITSGENAFASNPFGFLDSPPNNSISNNQSSQEGDFSSLKIKIDDLEFKLERFLERISAIELRLNDIK